MTTPHNMPDVLEPSDQDLGDTPYNVRTYLEDLQKDHSYWVQKYSAEANENVALKKALTALEAKHAELKALCEGMGNLIEQERNAIFYAMTLGQNYDIGLAKERMTQALTAYQAYKEGK